MSHIKLCIQLLNDPTTNVYCILEDDIDLVPDFPTKLAHCCNELKKTDWDMFYLGHHLWKQYMDNEAHSKTIMPKVEQFDRAESLMRSMGGTGGYLINKKGAEKLLNFINESGMTNGIDTVQQKSADVCNVFYAYPHLIYSECFRGDNDPDTDIQHNFESLTVTVEERLIEELSHYTTFFCVNKLIDASRMASNPISNFYYESDDRAEIALLASECNFPCYTLDNQVFFVVPKGDIHRYFHRFRKNGEWTVDDAIVYK